MKKSANNLYNRENTFLRGISRITKEYVNSRILYRALVTFVDRIGSNTRSRFSIQAKVVGVDPVESSDVETLRFYPSLFPISLISIPEVGEEVFILCEELGNLDTGHWLFSNQISNHLTKTKIGENIVTDEIIRKTGNQLELIEKNDTSPNEKYTIPVPRVKPGDVVIQGRSNTFVRNSFDIKNKKGIIEEITEESGASKSEFFKDEYRSSDGSRLLLTTLSNIDSLILKKLYTLNFHEKIQLQN